MRFERFYRIFRVVGSKIVKTRVGSDNGAIATGSERNVLDFVTDNYTKYP